VLAYANIGSPRVGMQGQSGSDSRLCLVGHERTRLVVKIPLRCLSRVDWTRHGGASSHLLSVLGRCFGRTGEGTSGRGGAVSDLALVRPVST
jgi:hypothetical protein